MRNSILAWLALVGCVGLVACDIPPPCEASREVTISLYSFSRDITRLASAVRYDRVRMLNARAPNAVVALNSIYPGANLPVSIAADSTAYAFEAPGRTDTLVLRYRRNIFMQRQDCGYVVTLDSLRGSAPTMGLVTTEVLPGQGGRSGWIWGGNRPLDRLYYVSIQF